MTVDRDEIILDVAKLIWRKEITIGDFFAALGVDLENMTAHHVDDVTTQISGIFTGWQHPPEADDA